MPISTEPIGSIPRPPDLLAAMEAHTAGKMSDCQFHAAEEAAVKETIRLLEETGSPVLTDGEQTKPSFATYPLVGVDNVVPDGVTIPFRMPFAIFVNVSKPVQPVCRSISRKHVCR